MTVRVALVGLGCAARSIWLPRLRRHPAFELTVVVDPDQAARQGFDPQGGHVSILPSVDDLAGTAVDLAVIAAPNHLHCDLACRLLARGLAVFVEKPVCLNSAEADRLLTAERAGDTVLLGGSAARYRADVQALYGLAGQLGQLRHIELAWIRARGVPNGWFTRRGLAGGGALVDLGWHLLDTISPLLGTVTFDQVTGTVSADFLTDGARRAAWRHDSAPDEDCPGDVEDTARGFLVTENGVSVSLRTSWASHEAHDVTTIRVEGSAGAALLTCTFGFSPHRRRGSTLSHIRDGASVAMPVAQEPIGAEYCRQLDQLPRQLTDPACRGLVIEDARWTIGTIERLYASASAVMHA
ncbi:MAG: Gfo/Idh/MocA family protein [Pseudonocardiaceae bacterium]